MSPVPALDISTVILALQLLASCNKPCPKDYPCLATTTSFISNHTHKTSKQDDVLQIRRTPRLELSNHLTAVGCPTRRRHRRIRTVQQDPVHIRYKPRELFDRDSKQWPDVQGGKASLLEEKVENIPIQRPITSKLFTNPSSPNFAQKHLPPNLPQRSESINVPSYNQNTKPYPSATSLSPARAIPNCVHILETSRQKLSTAHIRGG